MMFKTVRTVAPKNNVFFPDVDQIFNDILFQNAHLKQATTAQPPVNITANDSTYVIALAAPGLQKADFLIKVEKDLLTISAKKELMTPESETLIRKEFSYQSFERTFHLDEKIDTENIVANYENGILTLTLAKKAVILASVRNISIV